MTVALAGFTVNDCGTFVAAVKLVLPVCEAVRMVVPAPVMVTVLPSTVATSGFELEYETARPEEEVAVNANDASPKVAAGISPNVIVCEASWMTSVPELLPTWFGSVMVATTG